MARERTRNDRTRRRDAARTSLPVTVVLALVTGCSAGTPEAAEGAAGALEVTVVSDASRATVPPVCVGDIPEDLTACPGAPENLGQLELDETRKVTVQVPAEVAESGYRVRVNGAAPAGLAEVLEDQSQPVQVSAAAVAAPGETVLTVEALTSVDNPKAVWQFLLSDPARPPD